MEELFLWVFPSPTLIFYLHYPFLYFSLVYNKVKKPLHHLFLLPWHWTQVHGLSNHELDKAREPVNEIKPFLTSFVCQASCHRETEVTNTVIILWFIHLSIVAWLQVIPQHLASIWILCLFLMCKNWKKISSHVIWNKKRKKPINQHTKLSSLLDLPQWDGTLFLTQQIIIFKVTSVNRAHSHGPSFLLSCLHPLHRCSFTKAS